MCCLRRNSCLTQAGSANRQECTRRQGAGEQGGTARTLTAEELQSQLQTCSCTSLKRVKGKEGTRLWGKDWSAQVSPVTESLLPPSLGLSGCLLQAK